MKFSVFAIAGLFAASPVYAASLSMVCQNPVRQYPVKYEEKSRAFLMDDTVNYKVLGVERTAGRYVIVGLTVNDGPTFRAYFRPPMKIEFFMNSKLMQTDRCHK